MMSRTQRVLQKILGGTSDRGVRFRELRHLMKALKFDERIRGDHHIYSRADVVEIINVQPRGAMAKAYQVKQVRELILKYRLAETN